jgi:hypothetical protein
MIVALGTLTAAQSQGTEATVDALTRLLNYAATHPDAQIRYTASNMTLYVHSNALYLSVTKAQSHVGGHFYLSAKPSDPKKPPPTQLPSNGAVHTVCNILKNVMSSATEAEFAGLFHNAKDDAMIRNIGHSHPPRSKPAPQ